MHPDQFFNLLQAIDCPTHILEEAERMGAEVARLEREKAAQAAELAALAAEIAELRAKGSQSLPDGWVAVPMEPTPEMLDEWAEFEPGPDSGHIARAREDAIHAYRAMLSARPTHPNTTPTEDRTDA